MSGGVLQAKAMQAGPTVSEQTCLSGPESHPSDSSFGRPAVTFASPVPVQANRAHLTWRLTNYIIIANPGLIYASIIPQFADLMSLEWVKAHLLLLCLCEP